MASDVERQSVNGEILGGVVVCWTCAATRHVRAGRDIPATAVVARAGYVCPRCRAWKVSDRWMWTGHGWEPTDGIDAMAEALDGNDNL